MKPKFLIGMTVIFAAIVGVMAFAILGNSSMEVRVNELLAQKETNPNITQQSFKLTGFVVGDSIVYDPGQLHLEFDLVATRNDLIHNLDKAKRVRLVYKGIKPDTLMHEASAIATGKLAADGKFYVPQGPDTLMLQCPTKYQTAEQEKQVKR